MPLPTQGSENVRNCRRQVEQIDQRTDASPPRGEARRETHDQRDVGRRLAHVDPVADVALLAQRLAVVAGDDHDQAVPQPLSLEGSAQLADLMVT